MQPFHVVVRSLPLAELPKATISIGTKAIDALTVPQTLQATPLDVTFEAAYDELEALPRMYIEPDGSFVWVSIETAEQSWQVDGNLYDRDGSLVAIDLKGTCDREHLTELFNVFRAESRSLMIELVAAAVFVHEADFIQMYC